MTKRSVGRFSTRDAVPKFADSTETKPNPSESRSLFHYTTANGLIGILKSQSLWATHANFLNDSAECRILSNLLRPRVANEMETIVPELVKIGRLRPEVYEEYGRKIHEMQADKVIDSVLIAIDKIAPFYITSFCIHDPTEPEYENGLLSQWRGYANGGFAIEFDELQIDELAKDENAAFRYQGILTEAVSYEEHIERARLDRFDGLAKSMLRVLFEKQGGDLDRDFGAQVRHEKYIQPFLETLPFLKDSGFSEEREYRIAALCNRPNVVGDGDERAAKEIAFREAANGSVVPFIRLFESLKGPLPIKSILVGPHARQENQVDALRLLLEQCQIDVDVRLSKLTFRSA